VGIEQDAQDHLFDRFFRAPGAGDYAGVGLGLAITKAIVEHLGGTVALAASETGGLELSIALPR
jgi:two-component system sensor histidine kinase MprB